MRNVREKPLICPNLGLQCIKLCLSAGLFVSWVPPTTSGNYNTLDSGDRLAELLVSSGNTHLIYKYSYAYYVFKKLERQRECQRIWFVLEIGYPIFCCDRHVVKANNHLMLMCGWTTRILLIKMYVLYEPNSIICKSLVVYRAK